MKLRKFEVEGYFTWIYEGNLMLSHIATGLLIAVVIGFTLLPLWPMVARKCLWYVCVTFLIVMVVFILLRWALFLLLWTVGIEFWIFPNFFDETLSFFDSFKPVYTFNRGSPGQLYHRLALLTGMAAFCYWAYCQPTEWDEFVKVQKGLVDDLYAGKLLPDTSQQAKDTVFNAGARGAGSNPGQNKGGFYHNVPKLDDILKDLDEGLDQEGNSGSGGEAGSGGSGGMSQGEDHPISADEEHEQAQAMIDKMLADEDHEDTQDI